MHRPTGGVDGWISESLEKNVEDYDENDVIIENINYVPL